jgi:hypothetical protein
VAIAYKGNKELGYVERTSMELEKPGESGQIVLIWIYVENPTLKKFTVEQGSNACTQITPDVLAGAAFCTGAYWCVHDGTSSKIKVEWEGAAKHGSVLVLDAFSGVDTTTPVDVTGVIQTGEATALKWAALEIVTKGAWQIGMQSNTSGEGLSSTPAGWTLRTNSSPQTFSIERAATGATGETEIKWTVKHLSARCTMALRPSGGAKTVEIKAAMSMTVTQASKLLRTRVLKAAQEMTSSWAVTVLRTRVLKAAQQMTVSVTSSLLRTRVLKAVQSMTVSFSAKTALTKVLIATLSMNNMITAKVVRTRVLKSVLEMTNVISVKLISEKGYEPGTYLKTGPGDDDWTLIIKG